MYAYVLNDTIDNIGRLPDAARRLDTGQWVLGLRDANVATQQACGWFELAEVAQPAPSGPDVVQEITVELVDGVPTQVWTERPMTAEEIAAATAEDNRSAIERNLADDMVAIQAELDKTNSTINANPAATLKVMIRMMRRLGREVLNDMSGTD